MRRSPNPNSPEEMRRAIQQVNQSVDEVFESVDYVQFDTSYVNGSAVGRLQWNSDVGTLEFGLPGGAVNLQIGQEFLIPVRNVTGGTLLNGRLVYYTGVDNKLSTVDYADATRANWPKALVRGILTEDIDTDSNGYMLMAGLIHDVNTDGLTPGVHLYLSTVGDGTYTNTRPTSPDYVMGIGTVKEASATVGTVQIEFDRLWDLEWASNVHFSPATEEGQYLGWNPENDRYELQRSQRAFFNGTFRETFDALLYSTDGNDLFMTLEQADGGDLTMQFSDGDATLDCTPAIEIAITPGTDAAPTGYMVFIPQSTKVLTIDSAWPSYEHIKVAYLFVPSAQFVYDHGGPYVNQNHNNHLHGTDQQGHLAHISAKIRSLSAGWYSGVAPDGGDVSYFTYPTASDIRWESTDGVVLQMHPQDFEAQDTADTVLIVANGTTPYVSIQNLFTGITEDSLGDPITNNRYFSLVFWGVANKTEDVSGVMCNLPSGNYTLEANALVDTSKYDDYSFPREFDIDSSTAFLICRSTFRMGTTGWTHIQTEDLRGLGGAGGGAVSAITDHGGLGGLTDDDHAGYHTDARAATWLAANHETTYNHANFATAYGWGDHAGLYDPSGTMTTHESTYDHSLIGATPALGDNEALEFGSGPDYWFIYNSGASRFEFWSTDVDNAGTDGIIFYVDDSTDDTHFGGVSYYEQARFQNATSSSCLVAQNTSSGNAGYFLSNSNVACRAESTASIGVYGASGTGVGVQGYSTNFRAAFFSRNTASPSGGVEVVQIRQDHVSDPNISLVVRQDGTGDILRLLDFTTVVARFKDGGDVDFTGVLKTGGYKSSDGTAGVTEGVDSSVAGRILNFKNGLYVGYTDP